VRSHSSRSPPLALAALLAVWLVVGGEDGTDRVVAALLQQAVEVGRVQVGGGNNDPGHAEVPAATALPYPVQGRFTSIRITLYPGLDRNTVFFPEKYLKRMIFPCGRLQHDIM